MQSDTERTENMPAEDVDGQAAGPNSCGVASETSQEEHLALYQRCTERLSREWPRFLDRRRDRLAPHPIIGEATEKVTESILEDLFTVVLDWPLSSFNPQIEHADIVLSELGFKRLIIEAKRPGALAWNRRAVDRALEQARSYAYKQKVRRVAISDGHMLYAADMIDGGMQDRVLVRLASEAPPADLWWLSRNAIYRRREIGAGEILRLLSEEPLPPSETGLAQESNGLLHPKYKLPSCCFAYVGDPSKPRTWKLPYLLADGTIDAKRLPKAIQSVLTNYRGTRVSGITEEAVRAVLLRLAAAATQAGHMPPHAQNPAPVYQELVHALEQIRPDPKNQD